MLVRERAANAGKCSKCAELLRSKYAQLLDGKLGMKQQVTAAAAQNK